MGQDNNSIKVTKKTDPFLLVLVLVLLLKSTIELYFVDVLSGVVDNVFWVLITVVLTIYSLLNKKYIYFSILLVILVIGSINL